MKKNLVILVTIVSVSFYLIGCGCGRERESLESMQEPMSIDEISAMSMDSVLGVDTTASGIKLEPLPPQGPYKPTDREVQVALKNAGFYNGSIDGKIGAMTQKAIKEFQQAKGLKIDGKVGLNTWSALSPYLSNNNKHSGKN